jgi:cell division protein FtsB
MIMSRVLFSLFGKDITVKLVFRLILAACMGAILYLALDRVRDHFAHITKLEQENEAYKANNLKLEGQLEAAEEINKANLVIYTDLIEQRQSSVIVASEEKIIADARNKTYKEIRDAINATPQEQRNAVSPVLNATVDRLCKTPSSISQPIDRP